MVELADRRGLHLSSAPCNVLGETAQTVWKALRVHAIGPVRLAYAEMDDGLVHRMRYRHWKSELGVPWPWKDEFEVGCTLEHAGYYITWLAAFFGPAESVTAFSSCQVPEKETDVPLDVTAPDFSVAAIRFRNGVVARLTCSVIAPHDRRLRIFGDDGVLSVADCWNDRSPVYLKRRTRWSPLMGKFPLASMVLGHEGKKYPLIKAARAGTGIAAPIGWTSPGGWRKWPTRSSNEDRRGSRPDSRCTSTRSCSACSSRNPWALPVS